MQGANSDEADKAVARAAERYRRYQETPEKLLTGEQLKERVRQRLQASPSHPLAAADIESTLPEVERAFPGMMHAMGGDTCTCPSRDNLDLAGSRLNWIDGGCPRHAAGFGFDDIEKSKAAAAKFAASAPERREMAARVGKILKAADGPLRRTAIARQLAATGKPAARKEIDWAIDDLSRTGSVIEGSKGVQWTAPAQDSVLGTIRRNAGQPLPPSRPCPNVTPEESARDYDRMFPGQIDGMG